MNSITIFSQAKINIGLQVLNKRTDGYHNINTLFYPINLKDKLYFQNSKEFNVYNYPKIDLETENNLAYIAAVKLKEYYNINKFANIHIQKKIPMGGGLGGGSTNAASTLLALVDIWDLPYEYDVLHKIAASIGSDVPYFLKEQAAIGTLRGEKLTYFDLKLPWWILLVNPGIHISTKDAYEQLNRSKEKIEVIDFETSINSCLSNPEQLKEIFINDFEEQAFSEHPELLSIKEKMYGSGALLSLMSGSGSTFFGLYKNKSKCQKAAKEFDSYFTHICEPMK